MCVPGTHGVGLSRAMAVRTHQQPVNPATGPVSVARASLISRIEQPLKNAPAKGNLEVEFNHAFGIFKRTAGG